MTERSLPVIRFSCGKNDAPPDVTSARVDSDIPLLVKACTVIGLDPLKIEPPTSTPTSDDIMAGVEGM